MVAVMCGVVRRSIFPSSSGLGRRGERTKKVFMYTLSTCPWCRKTKKWFTEKGIPFDYVDYDLQTAEEQSRIEKEIRSRGSEMAFPWVLIDDELVIGWNPKRYAELLGVGK